MLRISRKERNPQHFLNFRQVPEKIVQWYRGNIDHIWKDIFFDDGRMQDYGERGLLQCLMERK